MGACGRLTVAAPITPDAALAIPDASGVGACDRLTVAAPISPDASGVGAELEWPRRGAPAASGVCAGEGTENIRPGTERKEEPAGHAWLAVAPAGDGKGPQPWHAGEGASVAAGASGPLHFGRGRLKPPGPPGLCRGRIGGGAAPDAPHATAQPKTAEWAVSKPPDVAAPPHRKAFGAAAASSKVSIQARPRSLAAADSSICWPPPDWNMSPGGGERRRQLEGGRVVAVNVKSEIGGEKPKGSHPLPRGAGTTDDCVASDPTRRLLGINTVTCPAGAEATGQCRSTASCRVSRP